MSKSNYKYRLKFWGKLRQRMAETYLIPTLYTEIFRPWWKTSDGEERLLFMFAFLKTRFGVFISREEKEV